MLKLGVIPWSYRDDIASFNSASIRSEKEWETVAKDSLGAKSYIPLVTCNRAELYFTYESGKVQSERIIRKFPHALLDGAAVAHLFRVAAGLESMSIGENEIMYQLKTTYDKHRASGACDALISNAFARAISFGKSVRENTRISRGKTSVPAIALDIASKDADLKTSTVCVVGTGRMAETLLKYFKKIRCKKLLIVGRNVEAGTRLAKAYSVTFKDITMLKAALGVADVSFVATSAAEFIIKRDTISDFKGGKLFIDISNPKNVDPKIAEVQGVRLISFETLQSIAQKNAKAKDAEISKAEKMLKWSVKRFELDAMESPADEILSKSYTLVESIAARETERLLKELKNGTDPFRASRNMASAMTKKILDRYTAAVKNAAATGDEKSLRQLRDIFNEDR